MAQSVIGVIGLAVLVVLVLGMATMSPSPRAEVGRRWHHQQREGGGTRELQVSEPTSTIAPPMIGRAQVGRNIFFDDPRVNCAKCHRIEGVGGEVGPDLSAIGSLRSREEIAESLLDPNRLISEEYATVLVETWEGQLIYGVLKSEDATQIEIMDVEGARHTIATDEIAGRRAGLSVMPADVLQSLNEQELADLVEFLVTRQNTAGAQ